MTLNLVCPRGARRWLNRFSDPLTSLQITTYKERISLYCSCVICICVMTNTVNVFIVITLNWLIVSVMNIWMYSNGHFNWTCFDCPLCPVHSPLHPHTTLSMEQETRLTASLHSPPATILKRNKKEVVFTTEWRLAFIRHSFIRVSLVWSVIVLSRVVSLHLCAFREVMRYNPIHS